VRRVRTAILLTEHRGHWKRKTLLVGAGQCPSLGWGRLSTSQLCSGSSLERGKEFNQGYWPKGM